VRAQRQAEVTRTVSHRDQVAFQHIALDHEAWSLKVSGQRRCEGHRDIVP
jgi:hypothetical protein